MQHLTRILLLTTLAFSVTQALKQQLLPLMTDLSLKANINRANIEQLLQQIDYLNVHLCQPQDAENDIVRLLLQNNVCPLQLSVDMKDPHFAAEQRHRALVLSSVQLESTLNRYAMRQGILICVFRDQPDKIKLTEMARQLWTTRGVIQVYYVLQNVRDKYVDIVYYNPFAKSMRLHGLLVNLNKMPYADIFRNFNGYPLRTYIFDSVYSAVHEDEVTKNITKIRGADCKVAQLLSEKLNFSMQLQWPDDEFFGARLDDGSYNGAIGRLIRFENDITLTGFFVKDYLTSDIDFSVSVYMDDLCCYVMKAKRIPQSILPLFAVHIDIWIAFLLCGLLCPFIWMWLRSVNLYATRGSSDLKRRRRRRSKRQLLMSLKQQFIRIYIDTWVVWVRVNVLQFPPFFSERIFIMSLCLVSVIFGALFESSLATVYIRPLYYKDINTMKELEEANVRIYIKHAAMKDDLFYGHSSTVYQNLNKRLLLVAELEERLINIMSKRGGFAAVTRASSLELDDIRYFITKKIHKIPECPKNYHIAFLFPSQSPLEKPINVLLLRFVEAGLIDHWIGEMKYQSTIRIHNFPDYMDEQGYRWKVLTLGDLQLAFYALLFGSSLAALSLLAELLLKCIFRKYFFQYDLSERLKN